MEKSFVICSKLVILKTTFALSFVCRVSTEDVMNVDREAVFSVRKIKAYQTAK